MVTGDDERRFMELAQDSVQCRDFESEVLNFGVLLLLTVTNVQL
jgi:hypothetical protein